MNTSSFVLRSVYHDFQKVDDKRRLVLTLNGTTRDLQKYGIELSEGLQIYFSDDEALNAMGIVKFNNEIGEWVADIDWTSI